MQAISIDPNHFNAFYNLGIVQTKLGKIAESEKNYQQAILLNPNFLSAKYMLSSLTGDSQPSIAPKEYVEGLFNDFADHYENLMIEKLEFKAPSIIRKIILDNGESYLGSLIDLGCGTGLFGKEIQSFCDYLEGIDLSEKMLEIANKKNIYNQLIQVDILEYLKNASLNFNYYVASDVLIYIGDLSDLFKLIKSRNQSRGKLVFSVEEYEGKDFILRKSGRYAHSKKYIKNLCQEFGYTLAHFETKTDRSDNNRPINFGFYILDF
jgi:predicted TPR repeat methyltransferase